MNKKIYVGGLAYSVTDTQLRLKVEPAKLSDVLAELTAKGLIIEKSMERKDLTQENMNKKIYVGGLAYSVTDDQLRALFEAHGTVESANVITDKYTDRSRGFGFVEMGTQQEAEKAIEAMNGIQHEGRSLTVNMSKPRTEGDRGGGGRGRSDNRW